MEAKAKNGTLQKMLVLISASVITTSIAFGGWVVGSFSKVSCDMDEHEKIPAHPQQAVATEGIKEDLKELKLDSSAIKRDLHSIGTKVDRIEVLIEQSAFPR